MSCKKNVFTRAELYCSTVTLKAYFGLFQGRTRKYTSIVCEECVFGCLLCTAKYLLSSTKHRNKAKLFFCKESIVVLCRWKYAFQTWLLQRPFHALWLCGKLAFERWGFCKCILSVGADSMCIFLLALWTAACTSFPKGGDTWTYKCIWVYLSLY